MKSFLFLFLSLALASCAIAQTRSIDKVPAELVGKWYNGSTSSLGFLNRSTGITNAAGGNGVSIEIKPDGSFIKATVLKTGLYGCSTVAFQYQTGKLKFEGDKISFSGDSNFISYKDSCNPQTNSEKNKAPLTREYRYEITTDSEGRNMLCFSTGEGQECFVSPEKK